MNLSILKFYLIITISALSSFGFDAKQGNLWASGGFSWVSEENNVHNSHNNKPRTNTFVLSPTLRFFPLNHLFIGPTFSWMGEYYGSRNENIFEVGGELGFVGSAGILYPYFCASPGSLISRGEGLFSLPFSTGLMLKISDHIGFQLELRYRIVFGEWSNYNAIAAGIGVCAFGKKTAVSVINQFMP